jgi:hypothetical protein
MITSDYKILAGALGMVSDNVMRNALRHMPLWLDMSRRIGDAERVAHLMTRVLMGENSADIYPGVRYEKR